MITGTSTIQGPRLHEVIEKYGYDIGLKDYPIFDEEYRETLNQAILDHFWLREIAAETPTMFIFFLNRTMREEMPSINPIFEALKMNQWDNVNMTSDGTNGGSITQTETPGATTTTTGKSGGVYSDTPQAQLYSVGGEDYATNLTTSTTEATVSNEGQNVNETQNDTTFTSNQHGRNGQPIELINAYVEGYNNATKLVFSALERCFSQLWADQMYI